MKSKWIAISILVAANTALAADGSITITGVIALGYCLGPWFARSAPAALRQRYLLLAGSGALLGFVALGKSSGVSETATSAVSNVANTDQLNSAFTALGPRQAGFASLPRRA